MEAGSENNLVRLCGAPLGEPVFSHESRGQRFYRLPLSVRRLSGTVDVLPLLLRQAQAAQAAQERLRVEGQLRSFNNRSGTGARLVLSVLAFELSPAGDESDSNLVRLTGSLCREPSLRRTPLGREVCDLLLAVNRRCGRSDYLPCICWGRTAHETALLPVGARVRLEGRFQSRSYIKLSESGEALEKTAYEVSASTVEAE